ncbi:hypothetical protein FEM48_Zijuj11G0059100 [Ziziphus jujuba var. spinosa]|uniref:Receptor-like protein kinase THESEUS 1 n=1 Tax=Ziziphus jujuba var. spinosa TaxID=714518 RepID=A0A978UH78_ZIZJJ|nr:hypothetical protein FEM48_Zijuj11G0059100 [Ziziphus jujuba var. spinosa]
MPDGVLPDQALAVNPSSPFSGLSELAFETVYRLNMGVSPSSIKYPAAVTPETAPNWVMPLLKPWEKQMCPVKTSNNLGLHRRSKFHVFCSGAFCDIVSKALNSLVFNVYINSDNALGVLIYLPYRWAWLYLTTKISFPTLQQQVNIAEWAMTWQKKGMLDQIMDQNLVGKVNPASLKKFGETAEKCLAEHGVDRPSMGDVLWNLEYALQLEETSSALMEPEDNSTNHIPGIQLATIEPFDNSVSMIDAGNSCTDDDAEDAATSAVFSQLVNPRGR